MNIEDWRAEIDAVDRELLRLLNRRAQLGAKIGELKVAGGLPLCDPEREQYVLTRACQTNNGPLDERAVAKIFRRLIRESRRVQARAMELTRRSAHEAKDVLR
ncbi:MAG: chorismate mutase [Acidobacteria bacterium]|nr:chorismate mutase [Acidobacteriota bacterium]